MGRVLDEEMDKMMAEYRHSLGACEVLHEEEGYEDTGSFVDTHLCDFDGAETHMHLVEKDMREERR